MAFHWSPTPPGSLPPGAVSCPTLPDMASVTVNGQGDSVAWSRKPAPTHAPGTCDDLWPVFPDSMELNHPDRGHATRHGADLRPATDIVGCATTCRYMPTGPRSWSAVESARSGPTGDMVQTQSETDAQTRFGPMTPRKELKMREIVIGVVILVLACIVAVYFHEAPERCLPFVLGAFYAGAHIFRPRSRNG